jgi:outer membrane receptor protein involved in Fe transport
MKQLNQRLLISALLLSCAASTVLAQTTGKIAGRIFDAQTGEALPGANVQLEGTPKGAAAANDGTFFIINIPPGSYSLKVQYIGYNSIRMDNVRVSTNRTTVADFAMTVLVLEGQTIVVEADKIAVKKDQTSSVRNVSSDQIEILPVQNVNQVINMQAGVVNGHFRGGRLNEVSYMIDGLQVDESFSGVGSMATLENDVIKDLEVITGTFNAEYGRAMSGIVNAITKDGSNGFHGSFQGLVGNYYTNHTDLFIGLKSSEINRNQDYKVQLEGPVLGDRLTFFVNARYQDNKNQFNAVRRFKVNDYSDYSFENPAEWIDTHNGDSSYMPIARSYNRSVFGKLSLKATPSLKFSLSYANNNDVWGSYDHVYKYAPDGKAKDYRNNNLYSFQINQSLSARMFHEIKLSYNDYYYGNYLYKNPLDGRYIHDQYQRNAGPGFFTGGQDKGHTERFNKEWNFKYDLTWQLHKHHSLKIGFQAIDYSIDNQDYTIQNKFRNELNVYENYYDPVRKTYIYPNYAPEILPDSTLYGEVYKVKPYEYSGYLQDKMEFDEMVINLGLRYDYFNPNTVYPSNWRNPANQLDYPDNPEGMSTDLKAKAKYQLSPRFGLSYQLSNTALLHFSYGHFFQMPPMYAMYANHSYLVAPTNYVTQTGNPEVRAQKTVQYEVGLWQEITKDMDFEVNLFYRDIYDLLSMRVMSTYNQILYGLYSNKDYGNVKGLEIKYDLRINNVIANVNYTLQYTRGNADNPTQTFTRAGESMDPIARLIPMSWDQRHTFNATVGYATKNMNATFTGYYGSGFPYTYAPLDVSRLYRVNLYPNNSMMPNTMRVDFYGFYDFQAMKDIKLRFSIYVDNLLDRKNEIFVNGQTGHANEAIIRATDLASHRSLFNTYKDRIINPSAISSPRYVKFGLGVMF